MAALVGGPVVITSEAECDALIAKNVLAILFFWADWHEPSKPGGQMDQVVSALAAQHGPSVVLAKVRGTRRLGEWGNGIGCFRL